MGTLLSASTAVASDDLAENYLVDAVLAQRARDFDKATASLAKARAEVRSPELSARIERQAGLIFSATGKAALALQAFRRAVAQAPGLTLGTTDFGPSVQALFECAQRMDPAEPEVERLERDGEGWVCPTVPEPSQAELRTSSQDSAARSAESLTAAAPIDPPSPRLGPLGSAGLILAGAGLGVGAAVFVWARVAADESASEIDELRGTIAQIADDPDQFAGDRLELVRRLNQAELDRADQELAANVAAGVGAGVIALGLVFFAVDFFGDSASGETSQLPIGLGPGQATLTVRF